MRKDIIFMLAIACVGTAISLIPEFFPEYPHLQALDGLAVFFFVITALYFLGCIFR